MLQTLLPAAVEAAVVAAAGWLLTYLLHSTILLGGAWLLERWTRIAGDARLRSWLWKAALVGGVVTATVAGAAGTSPPFELRASEAEKAVLELTASGGGPPGRTEGALVDADGGPSATVRINSPHRRDRLEPLAWLRAAGHDWPFFLVVGSLLAAAAALTVRTWRLASFARRLRSRVPIESGPIRAALDELEGDAGDSRPVRLTRCDSLASPVALPGREICLPSRACRELDEAETRALLAHELAHLRRRDPAALLALSAVEAVLAVQPLNRLARRRLATLAEARTDDRVRRLGLGVDLASTLVTVGRWMRGDRTGRDVAGLAREDGLEERVRRLLGRRTPRVAGSRSLAAVVGAGALLGAAAVLSPGMRIATPPHAPHLGDGSVPGIGTARRCGPGAAAAAASVGAECAGFRGPPPDAERALADGPGVGLYLRVDGLESPLSLRLRPGRGSVRWHPGAGAPASLPLPADRVAPDGRVVALRVSAPSGGEHALYLPPAVRRLTLVVNGEVVGSGAVSRDGDLPRLVAPTAALPARLVLHPARLGTYPHLSH